MISAFIIVPALSKPLICYHRLNLLIDKIDIGAATFTEIKNAVFGSSIVFKLPITHIGCIGLILTLRYS